jgi:hypothetical protein
MFSSLSGPFTRVNQHDLHWTDCREKKDNGEFYENLFRTTRFVQNQTNRSGILHDLSVFYVVVRDIRRTTIQMKHCYFSMQCFEYFYIVDSEMGTSKIQPNPIPCLDVHNG